MTPPFCVLGPLVPNLLGDDAASGCVHTLPGAILHHSKIICTHSVELDGLLCRGQRGLPENRSVMGEETGERM